MSGLRAFDRQPVAMHHEFRASRVSVRRSSRSSCCRPRRTPRASTRVSRTGCRAAGRSGRRRGWRSAVSPAAARSARSSPTPAAARRRTSRNTACSRCRSARRDSGSSTRCRRRRRPARDAHRKAQAAQPVQHVHAGESRADHDDVVTPSLVVGADCNAGMDRRPREALVEAFSRRAPKRKGPFWHTKSPPIAAPARNFTCAKPLARRRRWASV